MPVTSAINSLRSLALHNRGRRRRGRKGRGKWVLLKVDDLRGAKKRTDWHELSGRLREAFNAANAALAGKGKVNYGIGSFNKEQTMAVGEAWVGPGYRVTSNGFYESADGLRQFRPPSFKPPLGKTQANFEQRLPGQTKWGANGHVDVVP